MEHLQELSDIELLQIIKNESSSEFDIEESKEILFMRYSYMSKNMLKKLRLKYNKSDEVDLIHHGHSLFPIAIEKYDIAVGCPFKIYLFNVLKRGLLNQFFQKDKFRNNEISMTGVCSEYDVNTIDSLSAKSAKLNAYEELMLGEQIEDIKTHLTESEYKCVMARYYGASYKETASTFGYTVKQVDNKIQSVRKDKLKFFQQLK